MARDQKKAHSVFYRFREAQAVELGLWTRGDSRPRIASACKTSVCREDSGWRAFSMRLLMPSPLQEGGYGPDHETLADVKARQTRQVLHNEDEGGDGRVQLQVNSKAEVQQNADAEKEGEKGDAVGSSDDRVRDAGFLPLQYHYGLLACPVSLDKSLRIAQNELQRKLNSGTSRNSGPAVEHPNHVELVKSNTTNAKDVKYGSTFKSRPRKKADVEKEVGEEEEETRRVGATMID
ncbi:hypothetical protein K438DRAFT_1786384 [Mycena galopus ATCC 62051]|nr:hypothetical protein K438DRAFT_1786384 [Mycena galopus ATCC 62051]